MSQQDTEEQKRAYQRLAAILDSIKKYCVEIDSWNKPWYILLGCNNSGRSQLLESMHDNWQKFSISKQATAWIANDANYIEPNADLLNMDDASVDAFWKPFAAWLRKNKGNNPFANSYLFLDTRRAYTKDDNKLIELAARFNQQINWLQDTVNNPVVTICLSQFDQLPGLNEYAKYLDQHQQESIFGFPIGEVEPNSFLSQTMTLYDLLVQSITNRIFITLQQCDEQDKSLIEQFPVQMQFLKQKLQLLLKHITAQDNIKQIIFISTEQKTPQNNIASKTSLATNFVPTKNLYFVQQIFASQPAITQSKAKVKPKLKIKKPEIKFDIKVNKKASIIAGAAFIILIVIGAFLLFESRHEPEVSNMSFQEMLEPSDIKTTIAQLNQVYGIINSDKSWRFSWSRWGDSKNYQRLMQHTSNQYQQLLKQKLLPYVVSRIGTNLEKPSSDLDAWNNLKLYQMLNNPSHRNTDIVQAWVDNSNISKDNNFRQNLKLHLRNLLNNKEISNSPGQYIIGLANKALNHNSIGKIAYAQLSTQWQKNIAPAYDNLHTTDGITWYNPKIETAMQHKQVATIFNKTIPDCAEKFNAESQWVLLGTDISTPTTEQLNIAIQIQYLEEYHKVWQAIIDGIKVSKDINENSDSAWKQLADHSSNFWKNFDVIIDNVKPATGVTNFNKTVAKYFTDLSNLSNANVQNQLAHWQQLRKNVLSGNDNYKAAFDFTSQTITNNKTTDLDKLMQLGNSTPAPVGSIIKSLAQNDWQLFLNATMKYINFHWSQDVYNSYENLIVNKYPIFKTNNDISLQDFSTFFGPKGVMDNFFSTYISPFVTTHHVHWTLNRKYNSSLNISKKSLDIFIRASLIQAMFFHDNKLGFKFNLQPVNFSQNTTEFILNIAGQMIQVLPGDKTEFSLSWPGPQPTFTTMRFSNASESNPTITKTGPWSWFKILDISHLKTMKSVKDYDVTFAIGDDAATFSLTNPHVVNAFIPGVLNKFRIGAQIS